MEPVLLVLMQFLSHIRLRCDFMNIYHRPICVDIPKHEPIRHIYLGQKDEKYTFIDDDADTEYMTNRQEKTKE